MELPVLVNRARSEFNEMPGLQLTPAQAARLWGLDMQACWHVINTLVESSFLRWTPRGTVVRVETPAVRAVPVPTPLSA
ncbi:MAG: hypothetical protein HY657_16905 [Acidobacteria bacterium]|nr:hypothetical protein [Acidobacteriota bacterium]